MDSQFESQFFSFRRKVQQLEKQLGQEVGAWLHRSSSLQTQLRIMEMFQYSSQREVVKVGGSFAHSLAITYVVHSLLTDVIDCTVGVYCVSVLLFHVSLFHDLISSLVLRPS